MVNGIKIIRGSKCTNQWCWKLVSSAVRASDLHLNNYLDALAWISFAKFETIFFKFNWRQCFDFVRPKSWSVRPNWCTRSNFVRPESLSRRPRTQGRALDTSLHLLDMTIIYCKAIDKAHTNTSVTLILIVDLQIQLQLEHYFLCTRNTNCTDVPSPCNSEWLSI